MRRPTGTSNRRQATDDRRRECCFAASIAASVFFRSPRHIRVRVRLTVNEESPNRTSRRRPTISGKHPRRKYGRSISRPSLPMMRDRLESEHVFFLDLRASLIRSISVVFAAAPTQRPLVFCAVRLWTCTPYSVSVRVDSGSKTF